MKYFLLIIIGICISVLSGCMTVYETDIPSPVTKFSQEAKLRLEGFNLQSLREAQHNVGYSTASAYNYRTNRWTSGRGSYYETTYERLPDEHFFIIIRDIFENSGANIRTKEPGLTIEGRVGDGHFIWTSPAMWYRDVPIFIFTICTLGMVVSCERENDITLVVYGKDGKKLKEYHSCASYHTVGIGFPFALFANEKIYDWYGDRMATKIAFVHCFNDFIRDYNDDFYKQHAVTSP